MTSIIELIRSKIHLLILAQLVLLAAIAGGILLEMQIARQEKEQERLKAQQVNRQLREAELQLLEQPVSIRGMLARPEKSK